MSKSRRRLRPELVGAGVALAAALGGCAAVGLAYFISTRPNPGVAILVTLAGFVGAALSAVFAGLYLDGKAGAKSARKGDDDE